MLGSGGTWTGVLAPLETRVTTLEGKYVRTTRFALISSGTSGTLTIPANSTIVLDDFGGTTDAVISKISGSRPTFEAVYTSDGTLVSTSFDSSGNYTLTGTPSAYSVAIIYRVRQALKDFDSTATDIIGGAEIYSNIDSTSLNTANTNVKRDSSGAFASGPINVTNSAVGTNALTVNGIASQTGKYINVKNSANANYFSLNADGTLDLGPDVDTGGITGYGFSVNRNVDDFSIIAVENTHLGVNAQAVLYANTGAGDLGFYALGPNNTAFESFTTTKLLFGTISGQSTAWFNGSNIAIRVDGDTLAKVSMGANADTTVSAQLKIQPNGINIAALILRGAVGQSENLLRVQDSAGTSLLTVSSAGKLDFRSNTATTATAGVRTLPANPDGFAIIQINGVDKKIPYYAT